MPSGGSVSADVGTSLLRIGAIVGLSAAAVALFGLLLRWMTGQLRMDRAARRRAAEQTPPVTPGPARPPARRRPAAGHHPVGRRTPGAQVTPPVAPPVVVRPRRPVQAVAADVRRLTRELERMRLLAMLEAAGLVVTD